MKKQTIIYWVVVMILLIGCIWLFTTKTEKSRSKPDAQYVIDSLNSEIMGLQIDNGRYEIILNQLWEADSNFVMEYTKHIE
jgi:hypothetical protein